MPTQSQIDDFVKRVVGWTRLLQTCADAATQKAHDDYLADRIGLGAYSDTLQQQLETMQKCVEANNAASKVLLATAEASLAPIANATEQLAAAIDAVQSIEDGVRMGAEVLTAASAIAAALSSLSVASIAAAGAAIGSVANDIADSVTKH